MAASQVTTQNPSAFGDFLPSPLAAGYRIADTGDFRDLFGVFLGAAERAIDGVAIIAGVHGALALFRLLGWGSQVQYPASAVLLASAGFALLFVVLLGRHGGYRPYVGLLAVRDTERILRVTVESLLLALLAAYVATERISRLVVLLSLVTVPTVVIFAKWETRRALHLLRAKGYGARRAVIVGAGTLGRRMYSALVRSPKFGLDPVAFVDDDPQLQGVEIYESSYQRRRAARVFAGPVGPVLLRELDASVLVIATPGMDREVMVRLAAAAGVDTYCVREDFSEPGLWIDHAEFDGITLAHFSQGQARIAGDVASARWTW
jgi:FlaA1/EpsC-like NDP-sugar epimerase